MLTAEDAESAEVFSAVSSLRSPRTLRFKILKFATVGRLLRVHGIALFS